MRHLIRFLLLCLVCSGPVALIAQPDCTDSLSYVLNSAEFVTLQGPMADSVLRYRLVNNSSTYYVYPMSRVVPVSPLPAGTSVFQPDYWHVFQSSWNPGDSAWVTIPFDVSQPIPPNFMTTFEIWVNYNEPLEDTCKFPFTIALNLNPQTATATRDHLRPEPCVYPNPTHGHFRVRDAGPFDSAKLFDLWGRKIAEYGPETDIFEMPQTAPGRYWLRIDGENGPQVLPVLRY